MFGLGSAKLPGVAFDIVAAVQVGPYLEVDGVPDGYTRAVKASFASNLVTLGLHTASIAGFYVGAFADDEDALGGVLLLNAGCDLAIAVLGIATGVDLLIRREAAGVMDTDPGFGATWSSVVNIVMGAFGGLWFTPMLIGGLVAADEMSSLMPVLQDKAVAVWLEPSPSSITLRGRF